MSRRFASSSSSSAPLLAFLLLAGVAWLLPAVADAAPPRSVVGQYFCAFRTGEFSYPAQPCRIHKSPAGALLFEKTGGSQRFSGPILLRGSEGKDRPDLRFRGLFFCPEGACDEFVEADFRATDTGGWIGTFTFTTTDPIEVTVTRTKPRAPVPAKGNKN
ncbi:MAG: hypothetical protein RBU45_16375 [Myxococcota bacterium]|jgi:hypothetical protein|nr:hypothetical protein [Myxococcota bacterium]